jgi:hypothetical protein
MRSNEYGQDKTDLVIINVYRENICVSGTQIPSDLGPVYLEAPSKTDVTFIIDKGGTARL